LWGTNGLAYFAAAFVRMKNSFFNKDNFFSLFSFYQGMAGFEPTISGPVIDCSAPCGKVNKATVFSPVKAYTS